ncbi:MAG: phage portal protein [Firmicutes bacterium]|nr:phage portal protein [Bacillota bacterium]
MITIDRALLGKDGLPDAALLLEILKVHEKNRTERLDALHEMYDRNHAITSRSRLSGLPNNKLVHDFPGYIVTMAAGYLVGKPVQYAPVKEAETAFEKVGEALKAAKADCVDAELAVDASVYGKAVEFCYADRDARPKVSQINPRSAFVVYDDTVEHVSLFGVTIAKKLDRTLKENGEKITVYTDTLIVYYERQSSEAPRETSRKEHYFGGVPIVEYWNNAREDSDFAPVEALIDAYDVLQSDRVNDKQQFTDAIMVLKGIGSLGADDTEEEEPAEDADTADTETVELTPSQRLRQTRTLFLPGDGADANFMTKPDAESGNEVLRKSLAEDIHKFSFVPDLTDENFAGNTSGVAMRFKLLGLEQITKIKERWFREGLQNRLKLFARFLSVKGAAALDVTQVQITFNRSLPVNELEIAQTLSAYDGMVPQELLLAQVPFVEDAEEAAELMAAERAAQAKESAMMFATQPLKEKPGDKEKA